MAKERENGDRRKSKQTDGYVKCVQTDKGVVSRPEQVGLDRQSLFIDQVVPFASGAGEENGSKGERKQPRQAKGT
jgi:hypothetical protein